MTKIEAIIQPRKLTEVRETLKTIGVGDIAISEVRGHGLQREIGDGKIFVHEVADAIRIRSDERGESAL